MQLKASAAVQLIDGNFSQFDWEVNLELSHRLHSPLVVGNDISLWI